MPKRNNTNTPFKSDLCVTTEKIKHESDDTNVTLRRKDRFSNTDISTEDLFYSNETIQGNTLNSTASPTHNETVRTIETSNIVQQLSDIITEKLSFNNHLLMNDFKTLIHEEINKAMSNLRNEFHQKTDIISINLDTATTQITSLNVKIVHLENEITTLHNELHKLQESHKPQPTSENCKKIVVHGLPEYYKETDLQLYERVTHIFNDVLNINLFGYIENSSRIGKRRHMRPLALELLSKNMTNFILQNKYCFYNTGIKVTEYLEGEDLRKQNEVTKTLREARASGKHATIRNNRLMIDGIEVPTSTCVSEKTSTTNSTSTTTSSEPSHQVPRYSSQQPLQPNNQSFRQKY